MKYMLSQLKKLEFTDKFNYLFISNLIILSIFLVIPIDLFITNIQSSFPLMSGFFLLYLANILFFILLNFLIYVLLKKYLENLFFLKILFFILIWIIMNGLFLPSIGFKSDFWLPIGLDIKLRYQIIGKLILCFFIYYLFLKNNILKNKLKKIFYVYFLIVITLNLAFFSYKFENKINTNLKTFGNGNFLIVSFDGISGNILEEVIESNNKYKSNFKDFILYPNYITFFPTTSNSLKSELINTKDINKLNKKNFIINDKEVTNRVYTYGSTYNNFSLNDNKLHEGGFFKNDKTFFLINLYNLYIFPSFARWSTNYLTTKIERFTFKNSSLYISLMKILSLNFSRFTNEDLKYQNSIHRISILESDILFNKFKYDNKINTNEIYFFHFMFSHYRVRHDNNCKFIHYKERFKYQSYFGNIKITNCVAKKINFIINKLKENGVYNNTTIIFKSDHGKPIGYYKNKYRNMKINNNLWGAGRYNSFFMIKKNNSQHSEIKIDKKMLLNSDVYMHYCENIYLKAKCLKDNNDFIYIPSNKKAFQDVNDFEIFNIDRNKKLYQQLKEKNKIN